MVQSNLSKKSLRVKSQFDLSKSAENVIDKKNENGRKRKKEKSINVVLQFGVFKMYFQYKRSVCRKTQAH